MRWWTPRRARWWRLTWYRDSANTLSSPGYNSMHLFMRIICIFILLLYRKGMHSRFLRSKSNYYTILSGLTGCWIYYFACLLISGRISGQIPFHSYVNVEKITIIDFSWLKLAKRGDLSTIQPLPSPIPNLYSQAKAGSKDFQEAKKILFSVSYFDL